MKVAADTNVLLRAAVQDDLKQARAARHLMANAELIAVSLPCVCEFAWVLETVYKFHRSAIAIAIESLIQARNVVADFTAIEAGLEVLRRGGDFADGVLAFEGRRLGADTFISFDKEAIKLLTQQGHSAKLLS